MERHFRKYTLVQSRVVLLLTFFQKLLLNIKSYLFKDIHNESTLSSITWLNGLWNDNNQCLVKCVLCFPSEGINWNVKSYMERQWYQQNFSSFDPVIPFLETDARKIIKNLLKDWHIRISFIALFLMAKHWKQPRFLMLSKWLYYWLYYLF